MITGIKTTIIAILFYSPLFLSAQETSQLQYAENYFIEKSQKLLLSQKSEWRKILFYQNKIFQSPKGIVDGKNYYLSTEGKVNAQAEMEETIKAFFTNSKINPAAQCKFPRRLKWLKSHLDDDKFTIPVKKCEDLEQWLEFVNPNGAVLVFSSFYINNPSSMFGHTFMRIINSNNPLTDSGINFAANPDTENIILYTYKGLTGMFDGKFSLLPYSLKVQEYNNSESRDIWEYELNLTKEQITNMLLSLWEIGENRIDYFYLDENCSYILLALLDTANDDFNFSSKFFLWVNPSDTLRVVHSYPNLIKNITFRPSSEKRFRYRYAQLDPQEKKFFKSIIDQDISLSEVTKSNTKKSVAKILDAISEYIDYKENLAGTEVSKKYPYFRKQLLKTRASLGVISEPLKIEPPISERPENGLPGGRVGISYSHSANLGNTYDFEFYPVLHSIENPSIGYSREAQIELLSGAFRYEESSRQFFIKKLDLVNIISIPSINPPLYPIAWNLKLGIEHDYDCSKTKYQYSCVSYALAGGAGAAILLDALQLYAFPQLEFSYQEKNAFEIGLGTFSGLTFKTSDRSLFSANLTWQQKYSVLNHSWRERFMAETKFSILTFLNFQNSLFYKYNFANYDWQVGLGIYWHFY